MKRCPKGKRRVGRICKRKPKARAKAKRKTKRKASRGTRRAPATYTTTPRMSDQEWDAFTKDFNDSTPESFWSDSAGNLRHNRDGGKVDPAWNGYRSRR